MHTDRNRLQGGSRWIALSAILAHSALIPFALAGTPEVAEHAPPVSLAASGLDRDIKEGWVCREFVWLGDLTAGETRRIARTLFRGNDYRYYAYAGTKEAVISFHIEDAAGKILDDRNWQKVKEDFGYAGADFHAAYTGIYYLAVKLESSPAERTEWALAYAYR